MPKLPFLRHHFRYQPYPRPIFITPKERELRRRQKKLQVIENLYKNTKQNIFTSNIPCPLTLKMNHISQSIHKSQSTHQVQSILSRLEQTKLLNQQTKTIIKPQVQTQVLVKKIDERKEIFNLIPKLNNLTVQSSHVPSSALFDELLQARFDEFLRNQKIEIKPHQMDVLKFLYHGFVTYCKTALLVISKMGSGKTRMVIEFANWLNLSFLIVTPNKIVPHVTREINKWKQPNIYGEVQDASFFTSDQVTPSLQLIIIDECHLIANKKTKKLVKEIQSLSKVWIILLSGTPGDLEDQLDVLYPFDKNANKKESICEVNWEPEYKPKQELIELTLQPDQWNIFDKRRDDVLSLPVKEQEKEFEELRKQLSLWKLPFIMELCKRAQSRSKKSILIVSEFSEVLTSLDLYMDKNFKRKRISKESRYIDAILHEFEANQFQFLLAYSGSISHGIDLAFVNELIFIEPQRITTNQKQTSGRLPRLGHINQDQTIISPFYAKTSDDMLYKTHFEDQEEIPDLE